MATVDLNADLGESYGRWQLGDDEALLRVVTSANVACGFHAGDPATLVRTCALAAEQGVSVGAQVGYHDLAGFGRRFVDVSPDDLYADVVYQIGALDAVARSQGTRVRYVKPHGALYNTVVHHQGQAAAVVRAVSELDPTLPLLGLPGSVLLDLAEDAGIPTVREAFADRAYTDDGTLAPRSEPGAVLHDADEIADRARRMVVEGVVETTSGDTVAVDADSVCLHGDSPDAVAAATAVRAVSELDPTLPLLGLPGSVLLDLAEDAGIPTVREAFADRAYTDDGTLAPRSEPGAVLHDADEIADRARRMVVEGVVETTSGDTVAVDADSVCLHGDSPDAVAAATAVRAVLADAGVTIRPFA